MGPTYDKTDPLAVATLPHEMPSAPILTLIELYPIGLITEKCIRFLGP